MSLADEITCEIADPNAVKVELINCSTSLIDSAKGIDLMWTAIGAIGAFGTMVLTVLIAHYAWKAWKTSREQLTLTRQIATEQIRLDSLKDFLEAFNDLAMFHDTVESHDPLLERAKLKATIWMLDYDDEMLARKVDRLADFISQEVETKVSAMRSESGEMSVAGLKRSMDVAMRLYVIIEKLSNTAVNLHKGTISSTDACNEIQTIIEGRWV